MLGFGMAFGVAFAALTRSVTRVARRASEIEVAQKQAALAKPAYLDNIPRSIIDKPTLDALLAVTPKEQWDDPPEESQLYVVKLLMETYGPGKATRMRFSDYWYLKNQILPADASEVPDAAFIKAEDDKRARVLQGKFPMMIPGPAGWWDSGMWLNWRGPEPFAGDQVRSAVKDSLFSQQFIDNMAFYRKGLKPWQRGLEIGMAHGYFIIGPFVSWGPLRNTPEAATVGMLAGMATILVATTGGLLFGTVIKPSTFDKPGEQAGKGWTELMQWHAIGGIGGAAFAHILITLFAL
jgi:photosystem I subunit 11